MEPLIRMTPRPMPTDAMLEPPDEAMDDNLDASEPDEHGPYPQNASEDRRAYHRWLSARRLPVVVGGYAWVVFTSRRAYGNQLTATRRCAGR